MLAHFFKKILQFEKLWTTVEPNKFGFRANSIFRISNLSASFSF